MDGSAPVPAQPRPTNQASLIRPEQVARLPHLNPEQKRSTEAKVKQYWEYIQTNSNNQNTPNYERAMGQLMQLSQNLMTGMKQFNAHRQKMAAQQQANPQAVQNQTQPAPNMPNAHAQQQQQSQQQQQQQQPQPQPQPQPNQQSQQPSSTVTFSQLLPEVQMRVNAQTFFYPPAMIEGTRPAEQWLNEAKARYGQAIQRAQMAKSKKAELQRAAAQRHQSGNPLSPEENNGLQAKLLQCDKAIRESQNFMEKFKEQQDGFQKAKAQQQPRYSQSGPMGQTVTGENGQSENGVAQQQQQQQQQNVQGPQAHTIQTAQAAARTSSANANSTNGQQAASQSVGTPVTGSQQTPIDQAAAAQAGFNAQNTMMSQASASRPATAIGPGPQSAVHPTAGANIQAPHAHPNSAVTANPLHAVNGMKAHPPPIPKNLQVSEPTPVQMPPARPTLNGGANVGMPGQLAQPALTTFPGYVLEQSEDGHLLSKKKLQDLVREVIGPNSDDQLTPEAEEICLNLVDDFVEDLITSGCRLAKLRGATTLEARDCMVVLERQYNLRVPGFSTDEARVVKKSGPAQGWAHKVSAVQAAKLMNGTGGVNGAGSGAVNGGS